MIPPSGPCPAKIMIVGEAPGEHEMREGAPFVGASGRELTQMLGEAGIMRSECFITNVCRERPPGNEIGAFMAMKKKDITPHHRLVGGRHVTIPIIEGLALLRKEIELCQPIVIIAVGNLALWALTEKWGILNWRGSQLALALANAPQQSWKQIVLPTIHPAAVLRQWNLRPFVVADFQRAAKIRSGEAKTSWDWRFCVAPTFQEAADALKRLFIRASHSDFLLLSVDIETRLGHIACIGFAWSSHDAICIPLMRSGWDGYWNLEEEAALVRLMRDLLQHPNVRVIGQNFIYDTQYIQRAWGITPQFWFDTMLANHVCFPDMRKALGFLSSLYCERHVYWKDDGKEWTRDMDERRLWNYNCIDCCRTFEIAIKEKENITAMGLEEQNAFQQSMFWPVLRTMNRGLRINVEMRAQLNRELTEAIQLREDWLKEICGHSLNPQSPKQMVEFFYKDLRMKPIINRESGQPTCDDDALTKLAGREPVIAPIIERIRELRTIGTLLSTFIKAKLDYDGRMRCSYNVAGTKTFRFSSSENAFGSGMNLENIPAGKGGLTSKGVRKGRFDIPNVRKMFIPDEGYEFFDSDLEGADVRIVAWEADCKEMKRMFAEGLAVYVEVAKEFYRDPTISKKHPKYQPFKSISHGSNYLGKPPTIARNLGMLVHEIDKIQRWYFGKFPEILAWQGRFLEEFNRTHTVRNAFGYKRIFLDRIEGNTINEAIAWVPQSTVALTINRMYKHLYDDYQFIEVLLQTHDSLSGQFPTERREEALIALNLCSKVVIPYPNDPLIIPVGTSISTISWGDCI